MKINNLGRLLVLTGCLCIAAELAAQNATSPQIQASPLPMLVAGQPEAPVSPDEHPLSGAQTLGIGSWGLRHSFLAPSLLLSETIDSNPLLLSSYSRYTGITNVGGNVQWMQYLGRNAEFRYSGAVRYDTLRGLLGYSPFTDSHNVAISKKIRFGRWDMLIDDEALYSQNSTFGTAGMAGTGSMVTQPVDLPSTSLQPNLLPNQSILTGQVGRITNTALIELDANLDPRDVVTLAASYGLLHFNSNLLTNIDQTSVIAGYNRAMTARDSFAVQGAFTQFNYQDSSASVSTEYFSALYARRIAGRTSIDVGGGPQITQSVVSRVNQSYIGWQGRAAVRYRTRSMNLSAEGLHTVSGGSGVLQGGTTTTTGRGTVSLVISRDTSMSLNSGVARNQLLGSMQSYDTQFAGLVLNRKINRYTNLFLSYDFQHQASPSVCTGPACIYTGLRNVFGIGFAWSYRQIGVP